MSFGTPVVPNKKLINIFKKLTNKREQKNVSRNFHSNSTYLFTEKVTSVTTSQYL